MSAETEAEDLTKLDALELSQRLQLARIDRDGWATSVADFALDGNEDLLPFALAHYAEAKTAEAVLAAENSRRCDEYRRQGLI
ncbi:hypothetical protein [Microlunatus parietis]|uniref:Uncharacterized protein n=1 Tax=Microlunatus parietis TaxID=682979 RepID=A0A7Y9I2D0_9ACTN|nr:hypothetical protein [Microlunatus parietis]NYE68847.1 hypothetical protein [Microlunatus parietis]